jgi:hypothetical protein
LPLRRELILYPLDGRLGEPESPSDVVVKREIPGSARNLILHVNLIASCHIDSAVPANIFLYK